jgi:DNA-binding NarL/FixJ family response regulator
VVGHAPDETTALQALRKLDGDVQLIIIDIFLKAGSGLGVLRRIEEAGLAAQRVVLTNYATPTMRATCAALGADRVFDKCGDLDELLSFCANLGGGAPPRLAPHRGG